MDVGLNEVVYVLHAFQFFKIIRKLMESLHCVLYNDAQSPCEAAIGDVS